ncbi:MAG TPA: hypothetical protein DCX17_02130 [Firmicutes bacterium]|jgi:hypothetical protein|nr:hypothetical protein [Bacillota bacterium]
MINLISLSEKEQRLLIILFILLVAVLALAGLIGSLVKKIMAFQARKVDEGMSYLVTTKVIKDEKHFRYIARKKNHRLVFAQFLIPLLLIGLDILFMYLYILITDDRAILNELLSYDGRGMGTLFFVFDWANIPTATFFGLTLPSDWPSLLNTPYFVLEAWPSYIFVTLGAIASLWLLIATQAFIARSWRIYSKSRTIFIKSLDTINGLDQITP